MQLLLFTITQVARAVDYVGGGTKALVEAKTLQKSKRKWCCCAIILLLIIIAIVIVVVGSMPCLAFTQMCDTGQIFPPALRQP
jgi:t-SNARE complex subunit (syntaxin)